MMAIAPLARSEGGGGGRLAELARNADATAVARSVSYLHFSPCVIHKATAPCAGRCAAPL